jgi:hypothetical protein
LRSPAPKPALGGLRERMMCPRCGNRRVNLRAVAERPLQRDHARSFNGKNNLRFATNALYFLIDVGKLTDDVNADNRW